MARLHPNESRRGDTFAPMLTLFASRPSSLPHSLGSTPRRRSLRTTLGALALTVAMAASGCGASVGPVDDAAVDAADAAVAADAATNDTGSSCVRERSSGTCDVRLEWEYGCALPDEDAFRPEGPKPEATCARLCPALEGTRPLTCRTSTGHGTWWLDCSRCP
jgi:hypothetical protein